jgi:hypothetical protein
VKSLKNKKSDWFLKSKLTVRTQIKFNCLFGFCYFFGLVQASIPENFKVKIKNWEISSHKLFSNSKTFVSRINRKREKYRLNSNLKTYYLKKTKKGFKYEQI